ncbi:MAG: prepilin-type N-terminal cleavage/methylation domain-containing protein [candidate division Zixibacteria bacterium]|nr:prepilin-type N-terminal cleavage/methylation domain-containing protein [candidate division Zixibacteria bacterium]
MLQAVNNKHGFTLIELIIMVVIIGILATIAVQQLGSVAENAQVEETMREMEELSWAIAGNPELKSNFIRSNFGYVGDVGALPPNLDALVTNPGSYATWNGPYIHNSFQQVSNDFKNDAWQTEYIYSGGVTISSTGSGSNIERRIVRSIGDLIRNTVSGNIYDLDGTPPGSDYEDSVTISLTIPNGSGGTTAKSTTPDQGGYFSFDSIPIGNHDILIVYEPDDDTLSHFVSVLPGSNPYSEYRLVANVWNRVSDVTYGLITYWKLDEASGTTASDDAGSNPGTLTNMAGNEWTTGQVDGALYSDGNNDFVIQDTPSGLPIGNTSRTLCFWVRYNSYQNGRVFGGYGNDDDGENFQLGMDYWGNDRIMFYGGSNAVDYETNLIASTYCDAQFHHFAVTYDGSEVKIFVDGTARDSVLRNLNTVLDDICLCGEVASGSCDRLFDGTVDDFRIYNRTLSDFEIQNLFYLGK